MRWLQEGIGYEGNTLYVNKKRIHFEFPIFLAILAEDIIWVQENIPNEVNKVDNVYGVSMDGEVLMRIQPPTREVYQSNNFGERMPYTGISLSNEGQCILRDFLGMRFIFDPKTGEIIGRLPSTRF